MWPPDSPHFHDTTKLNVMIKTNEVLKLVKEDSAEIYYYGKYKGRFKNLRIFNLNEIDILNQGFAVFHPYNVNLGGQCYFAKIQQMSQLKNAVTFKEYVTVCKAFYFLILILIAIL